MSSEAKLDLGSTLDWQAEHFRLTGFVPELPPLSFNWWEEICGQAPDSRTVKKSGLYKLEQGNFGSGVLYIETQPGRMDMILRARVDEQSPLEGIPLLGPYPKILIEFEELTKRWLTLENFPIVQRLAFGTPLYLSTETLKTGYQVLAKYLPKVQIDLDSSSDLLYQINRPRRSTTGVPFLIVNRLSKWSVARIRIYAPKTEEVRSMALERYACRLELDINTVPDNKEPLPKESLFGIFLELTSLASEISQKGDIA